jgi:hypothetical protein
MCHELRRNGAMTPLYNPRIHQWDEHFLWDEDFTIVVGSIELR